ncbi:hypothetical protein HPB48_000802 [Haemaphysalis longicornis]|uniref:Uncharacterized protein n=1 Tax=Haemaphysalis longicornis TaxID=44386 RepID=A0A9J6GIN3_HAELO|nr:hypothetical protein HPB48_000802 [Haemaphysalis longicornis]
MEGRGVRTRSCDSWKLLHDVIPAEYQRRYADRTQTRGPGNVFFPLFLTALCRANDMVHWPDTLSRPSPIPVSFHCSQL